MEGILGLLAAPFAACMLIAALHCYMGLHVAKRGVIFVDLALAQLAALGAAVALLAAPLIFGEPLHFHESPHASHQETHMPSEPPEGGHPAGHEVQGEDIAQHLQDAHVTEDGNGISLWLQKRFAYVLSMLFAFLGAAILALGRFRDERVPHEAVIGIVFVVSAAVAVLVLSKAPHGHERMEAMLVGSILFVGWHDVLLTFLLYLPLGILHFAIRGKMLTISNNIRAAEEAGLRVRAWDFLFYATFGLMVTQSVRMAGVLVVFSYLIIPAVCAMMFVEDFCRSLMIAWGIALGASILGLTFSALQDMPTGPSLVATFGGVLVLWAAIRQVMARMWSCPMARG